MRRIKVFLMIVGLVFGIVTLAWATANTLTSSTGSKAGSDPTFTVTYTAKSHTGVVVLVNYTLAASDTGLTLTFDKLNPSISSSNLYRHTVLSGTTLSAYTTTMTATGKYRIPIPMISTETKLVVNATFGLAAQGSTATIDFVEP